MKKRLNKSEIEIARKSSRILFVISFLLLVLLFVGFGCLYVMNIDVTSYFNSPKKEVKEKKETIKKSILLDSTPISVEVNIEDSNIKDFFNTVKVTNKDVCLDGGYQNQEKVLVSQLKSSCRYSIASKIYEKRVEKSLDGKLYVSEDDVKDAYESLYGVGTYEKQDSIPCFYKTNFMYRDGMYFTEKVAPEEGSSLDSYEKIIHATRKDEELEITSAVVYYEHVLGLLCKDQNCENSIGNVKVGFDYGEEYLSLYVEHNQKNLYQYTYHFQMDDAGFYRYMGYERTNE